MKARWLSQTGTDTALVVFGGWAVNSSPFERFAGCVDLLFVSDYRDLSAAIDVDNYDRVCVLAWSFGVAAYAHWQAENPDPFAAKAAVCGALTPVDRLKGIPPSVFRRTVDGLSHDSFQTFLTHAFGQPQPEQALDVTARAQELREVAARGPAPDTVFDRIWIADHDRIFPSVNLERAWAGQGTAVRRIKAPHVPFDQFDHWTEVFA
jgi:biotin synthesis protein BioG